MIKDIYLKKKLTSRWFLLLQQTICYELEKIEINYAKKFKKKPKTFHKKIWKKSTKKDEGGGISATIKNSLIFDSVGVNFSEVSGKFKKKFATQVLGAEKNSNYWASGISIVAHMKNPKIPAMHFNTRFIVTSKSWFGGGMDVTPTFHDIKESKYMHKQLRDLCLKNNKNYKKFKKWCDNYFYLHHRKEPRGIGGIFFDYEKKNWENNFKFVRELGIVFIMISKSIILNKIKLKWSKMDKEKQLYKRGRYVEFNLLYDRGTKFGLNSGGDVESIFMSLPPEAKWK